MSRLVRYIVVFSIIAIPGRILDAQNCPALTSYPTPSYDLADIPPSETGIGPNLNIAYVDFGPRDQRVWFGVDSVPGTPKIFYNRRYRTPFSTDWYWEFNPSPKVVDLSSSGASGGMGDVIYRSTAPFFNPNDGQMYPFIMYNIVQPTSCDGAVAGILHVSFSTNGTCWTTPVRVQRDGSPSFPCDGGTTGVPVETAGAILDTSSNMIYLVGIEGNIPLLGDRNNMDRTQTYAGFAYPSDPTHLYITGELSASGVVSPGIPGTSDSRFKPYNYFINHGIAFDVNSGYFYIGRSYPYPFDRGSSGPGDQPISPVTTCGSQASTCGGPPATLPNRTQIYRMFVGSLSNITALTTGTWQLLDDSGHQSGYWNTLMTSYNPTGACGINTPLQPPQTAGNRDYGSVAFLRSPTGNLSTGIYFAGDTFKLERSQAPTCATTFTEGTNLRFFTP
ncbi:MAG TPA: hypothetical protein VNM92_03350 [Thermoanaerobaculia bacterium]|nr:hypothetical protein [Thermoanaerobaculia bacterium]